MILNTRYTWLVFSTFIALLLPLEAYALAAENNLTSGFLTQYKTIMANASNAIMTLATGTFVALATIELTYSVGMKAMGGGDFGDVMRAFIKRMLFIGFWWWMFRNAPVIVDTIMDTMVSLAQASGPVSGGNNPVNPDNIIDMGIQVIIDTIKNLPGGIFSEFILKISMLIGAFCIFISMLVIAAFMALVLMEVYIVGYGSVFLLALGPNRHTNGYAQAYLRYLIAVGVKLFAIALIAAIGETIMQQQILAMQADNSGQIWATVAMCGILTILAAKAPSAISGAIAGISNSSAPVTAGGLIKGAAIAGAATAGVGAAAVASAGAGASAGVAASQGSGGGLGGAARGLGAGVMGAGRALGQAAMQEAGEAIGGRSGGSPYPRGGTAGGRMANRIKENSKSS